MENVVRRYHLKSLHSYKNDKDLVQNYKKYLWNNGLEEAYYDVDDVNGEIREMLQANCDKDNLILKDRRVERFAKEEGIKMVNEY